MNDYVQPGDVLQESGPELEKFVASKKYVPGVILALQAMVNEIRSQAVGYGSLAAVPPEMQAMCVTRCI